jgi:hypothetical protein
MRDWQSTSLLGSNRAKEAGDTGAFG